jgi:sensor histidine kinase regulating citrate/malate metabolism
MKVDIFYCLIGCVVLLAIIAALVLVYYRLYLRHRRLEIGYQNLEHLNTELRSQRHDYLNHIQVVYGLLELEEYDDLRRYLEPVYKRMQKTGKALRTAKPAINALIRAKMDEAERKGIDCYVEIKSNLKFLPVADWELCKVISNVVDNAMTAVEGKEGEKKIVIDITEDQMQYRFSISNNGPKIPEHMHAEIFKQGITSKKEKGHGMGLYIVRSIVKEYHGIMQLSSTDEETTFGFSFPKKEDVKHG